MIRQKLRTPREREVYVPKWNEDEHGRNETDVLTLNCYRKRDNLKHMGKAGRKTELTIEVIESICASIRGGSYVNAACGRARVSYRSFFGWKERGQKERDEDIESIYTQFLDAIEHAEADNEVMLVEQVASDTDWRAKMEILKRRYSDRWGDRNKMEMTGADGKPLVTTMPPITIIHKNEGEVPKFIDQTDESD